MERWREEIGKGKGEGSRVAAVGNLTCSGGVVGVSGRLLQCSQKLLDGV